MRKLTHKSAKTAIELGLWSLMALEQKQEAFSLLELGKPAQKAETGVYLYSRRTCRNRGRCSVNEKLLQKSKKHRVTELFQSSCVSDRGVEPLTSTKQREPYAPIPLFYLRLNRQTTLTNDKSSNQLASHRKPPAHGLTNTNRLHKVMENVAFIDCSKTPERKRNIPHKHNTNSLTNQHLFKCFELQGIFCRVLLFQDSYVPEFPLDGWHVLKMIEFLR